jgi:hypothetical protein
MRLLVRTHETRGDIAGLMAQRIAAEVPDAAIQRIAPLGQLFREFTGRLQIIAALAVLFGGCAFVVCVLALMSAVDAAVSSRWRELALRLALGSTMAAALRHVLWPSMAFAFSGVAISASLIVLLGPNIYLSLVGTTNPKLAVVAVVTSVGLAAVIVFTSLATSWRAYRIEPSRVLAQL